MSEGYLVTLDMNLYVEEPEELQVPGTQIRDVAWAVHGVVARGARVGRRTGGGRRPRSPAVKL
jgi:hypothetical protein